ncbi:MAG: hypothetical protein WC955_12910 [Elusimicrobiota bacterium]
MKKQVIAVGRNIWIFIVFFGLVILSAFFDASKNTTTLTNTIGYIICSVMFLIFLWEWIKRIIFLDYNEDGLTVYNHLIPKRTKQYMWYEVKSVFSIAVLNNITFISFRDGRTTSIGLSNSLVGGGDYYSILADIVKYTPSDCVDTTTLIRLKDFEKRKVLEKKRKNNFNKLLITEFVLLAISLFIIFCLLVRKVTYFEVKIFIYCLLFLLVFHLIKYFKRAIYKLIAPAVYSSYNYRLINERSRLTLDRAYYIIFWIKQIVFIWGLWYMGIIFVKYWIR